MAYCRNCGIKIEDGAELCPNSHVNTTAVLMTNDVLLPERMQEPLPPTHKLHRGLLAWSIINTVLAVQFGALDPLTLSILGIVFACSAKSATSREGEDAQLRIVRILNAISTPLNAARVALALLLWVILFLIPVIFLSAFIVAALLFGFLL